MTRKKKRTKHIGRAERGACAPCGWVRVTLFMVALSAAVVAATPGSAQVASDGGDSCRCVDSDGQEIESCMCFRAPDVEAMMPRFLRFDARPRLGITVVMREDARSPGRGAEVSEVLDNGPADRAGIRSGDVVTRLDGQSLSEPIGPEAERAFDVDASIPAQRLLALVAEIEPGQAVEVEYERDGERHTTVVEAEDLAAGDHGFRAGPAWNGERLREHMRDLTEGARSFRRWMMPGRGPGEDVPGVGGWGRPLHVVSLNPGLGEYFGATRGVLIVDAHRSSFGLEAGDVVRSIGGREVDDPRRFWRIVDSYRPDEEIEFEVVRDGEEMSVWGRLRD